MVVSKYVNVSVNIVIWIQNLKKLVMSIYCFYFHLFSTKLNLKSFLVFDMDSYFISIDIIGYIFFSTNIYYINFLV